MLDLFATSKSFKTSVLDFSFGYLPPGVVSFLEVVEPVVDVIATEGDVVPLVVPWVESMVVSAVVASFVAVVVT